MKKFGKLFQIRWKEALGLPECPYLYRWTFIFFGYWLYLKVQEHLQARQRIIFYIIALLFIGIYVFSIYPIYSIDLYEYIIRGRIVSIYHSNPYINPPDNFKHDYYYNIISIFINRHLLNKETI